MITKIIFLDIDGVLNSRLYYQTPVETRPISFGFCGDIDPASVKLLNELIRETYAKVVISSTWRSGRTLEEMQEILNKRGFEGEVIGMTPEMRTGEYGDSILRGNEILAWIKENRAIVGVDYHDYRHYVIFDDDSDMLYWQRNNYFQVDPYVGLTPNVCYRAKRFLNS
jgi:hypothetical protein